MDAISDINNGTKNAQQIRMMLDLSFGDGISHDGEVGEDEVVSHPDKRGDERSEKGQDRLTIFVSAIHGASL